MEFRDEEILKEKKAQANKKINELEEKKLEAELKESIYDDCIHVDGKEIRFARREFEDMGISLYMPETFQMMDEETKAVFYPFGNAPKHVMVDFEIPFQITLNKTGHKVPNEDMHKFIVMSAKLLENNGPKAKVLSKGVVNQKDHNIGIMEVVTRAIDSNVHNVMFNISIDGEIFMGNIHFVTKYSKRLSKVAKEIIDSIEYLEPSEEE